MAIFDLILEQTLDPQEVRDCADTLEPVFKELGIDVEFYDWELPDPNNIVDVESIRSIILGNLIYAAQDIDILPDFIETADFCFGDVITFDITNYTEEESTELRKAIEDFEYKTGLKVTIEE